LVSSLHDDVNNNANNKTIKSNLFIKSPVI